MNAGNTNQGQLAVAIGVNAGNTNQGQLAVAIGANAGFTNQSESAVAIGYYSGNYNQGINAVSIGKRAGYISQQIEAVAIGHRSGYTNQGTSSIAIGYYAGETNQAANSIVLNASGSSFSVSTSGFFANPIRESATSGSGIGITTYNALTSELTYDSSKTFVIPHPNDQSKYLVHACIEGPEAGIYYRGESVITNGSDCKVDLPEYVRNLGYDFTVQVTPIFNGKIVQLATSRVKDNSFIVFGENCEFFWNVMGKRADINVEPLISDVIVNGNGPYKWI